MKSSQSISKRYGVGIVFSVLWFLCVQVFQYSIVRPASDFSSQQDVITYYIPFAQTQGQIKENYNGPNLSSDFQLGAFITTFLVETIIPFEQINAYIKKVNAQIFAQIKPFLLLRVIRI